MGQSLSARRRVPDKFAAMMEHSTSMPPRVQASPPPMSSSTPSPALSLDELRAGIELERQRKREEAVAKFHAEVAERLAVVNAGIDAYVRLVDDQLQRFARRLETPSEWSHCGANPATCSIILENPCEGTAVFAGHCDCSDFLLQLSDAEAARFCAAVEKRLCELFPLLHSDELCLDVSIKMGPTPYQRRCQLEVRMLPPRPKQTKK